MKCAGGDPSRSVGVGRRRGRGSVERRTLPLDVLLPQLLLVLRLRDLGPSWSELRPASGRIVKGLRPASGRIVVNPSGSNCRGLQRGSGNADKGGHGAEEGEKPSEEPQSEDPHCNPRPNEDRDFESKNFERNTALLLRQGNVIFSDARAPELPGGVLVLVLLAVVLLILEIECS